MTWSRSQLRAAVLAGMVSCLLSSCVVPDADDSIARTADPAASAKPRIEGATGPLTQAQSRALIAKIDGATESDILRRHLAIEEAVAGSPLTAGNAVTVLRDGPETFAAIAGAVRGARHSLNLEYYTIEDVALDDGAGGTATLADLLIDRRKTGVTVNVIYDSYGSSDTPADFFARLAEAGVNLLAYHPIAPTNPTNALTLNDRDHRKILVADGVIGVVGGVNLSKNYQSKSPGSDDEPEQQDTAQGKAEQEKAPQGKPDRDEAGPAGELGGALGLTTPLPSEWRDTAVRLEGPAVAELQALFRDQWLAENGPPLDESGMFPAPATKGNQVARIIGSSPGEEIPRYYVTLISALRNAELRAWISAAYFVPTPEQKEELIAAAERGVDVRLLLAGESDSPPAIEAAQSHYTDLLDAGITIYETTDVVMHAKTVVIDGVWSAIGSSNFDYRSVLYNDEVEAIVLGAKTAGALEEIFTEGMKISTRIDPDTWEDERSLPARMKGFFSRFWENLL